MSGTYDFGSFMRHTLAIQAGHMTVSEMEQAIRALIMGQKEMREIIQDMASGMIGNFAQSMGSFGVFSLVAAFTGNPFLAAIITAAAGSAIGMSVQYMQDLWGLF